ncbi:hypothetical protein [Escherichia coli]|uniref:hypothetical protein n=1 Tax=Escherichia coli TaxID=562 RepID=UPI0038B30207
MTTGLCRSPMSQLDFGSTDPFERAISPFEEMAAYEALWSEKGATFKTSLINFVKLLKVLNLLI